MSNNNANNFTNTENQDLLETDGQNKDAGFEVSNQGQNLGGGKAQSAGTQNPANNQDLIGEDDFSQTDQTISQAAPGQTTTNTMQGGSDA